jgi:hypothetical protein
MKQRDQDQYSEQEAQQRFEKLVQVALKSPPKPIKSMGLRASRHNPRSAGRVQRADPAFADKLAAAIAAFHRRYLAAAAQR